MNREERTSVRERVLNSLALVALLLVGVVWPPVFGAVESRDAPEPVDIGKTRAGTLYLCAIPCDRAGEALRQSTHISAKVTGNLARVHVRQTFENASDDWVEGIYVFPLSTTAAVDELEMLIGDRRIRGEIQRKAQARATYEQAKREGRRASLVDQERPSLFTTSVANIAPRSSITVEIAYLDTIELKDGRYALSLPLSVTPRYTPGSYFELSDSTEGASRSDSESAVSDVVPDVRVSTATPEHLTPHVQNATLDIDLMPGFPLQAVQSLNHAVSMEMTGPGRRIRLQSSAVPTDRDFELVWMPAVMPDTYAAAFAEQVGEDAYVLVTLMPPQLPAERAYRREVIFIIDTSGSMAGPSIAQARTALQLGVSRLRPSDTFNVIRFSNDASSLFPVSKAAVSVNRQSAEDYIAALQANGGTQMRSALDLAFSMPPTPDALRQIVFVTDGSVSNEAELVKLIRTKLGDARLFTVGIGVAPNAYFMREAAAAGRGSYTFISQIELVRERMADLFRKLESPALVDLRLHWPDGLSATLASAMPDDLYVGDPLTIVTKLSKVPGGVLTLTGRSGGGAWTRQLPLRMVNGQAGVAKLWARERISELSRQKNLGGDAGAIEEQIVQLALEHHLVSDLTSLVAVDVTPVRRTVEALRSGQVPTSAPRGSAWARTTGFASTASAAPLLSGIGVLALLLAAALWSAPRRAHA